MKYPLVKQGLKERFTHCCELSDDPHMPFVFITVTGLFERRVYALCERHATPVLTTLPVVE